MSNQLPKPAFDREDRPYTIFEAVMWLLGILGCNQELKRLNLFIATDSPSHVLIPPLSQLPGGKVSDSVIEIRDATANALAHGWDDFEVDTLMQASSFFWILISVRVLYSSSNPTADLGRIWSTSGPLVVLTGGDERI